MSDENENDYPDVYDEIVERIQFTCMPNIGNDLILQVKFFDGDDMDGQVNEFLTSGSEDEIDIKLVADIKYCDGGILVTYYEPIKD